MVSSEGLLDQGVGILIIIIFVMHLASNNFASLQLHLQITNNLVLWLFNTSVFGFCLSESYA